MGVDIIKIDINRENYPVQFKELNEEMPKFVDGSTYGREAHEENMPKNVLLLVENSNQDTGYDACDTNIRDDNGDEIASLCVLFQGSDIVLKSSTSPAKG